MVSKELGDHERSKWQPNRHKVSFWGNENILGSHRKGWYSVTYITREENTKIKILRTHENDQNLDHQRHQMVVTSQRSEEWSEWRLHIWDLTGCCHGVYSLCTSPQKPVRMSLPHGDFSTACCPPQVNVAKWEEWHLISILICISLFWEKLGLYFSNLF